MLLQAVLAVDVRNGKETSTSICTYEDIDLLLHKLERLSRIGQESCRFAFVERQLPVTR